MSAACSRCPARDCRIEWHHPSGRLRGVPIYSLAVPLCVGCHLAEHRIWSRAALDDAKPSRAVVLRRFALFCHLEAFDDLAQELIECAEAMERAA